MEVGEGEVMMSLGDVAGCGRSAAKTPNDVPIDPVSVLESKEAESLSSSEAAGSSVSSVEGGASASQMAADISFADNAAQVVRQKSKRSRRTTTGSRVTPTLERAVLELVEGQVGKFTHSLCAPLREPVYFDPSTTSQPVPLVKSAPGDGDHVLYLGTHRGQLSKLLRVFRRARRDHPQLKGTFVVPWSPHSR